MIVRPNPSLTLLMIRWKDGGIIHTHLDERPYQIYKEKVEKVIQRCEKWSVCTSFKVDLIEIK